MIAVVLLDWFSNKMRSFRKMVKVGKCLCASYVLDCGTEKYLGSWKESHVSCYKVIGPLKVNVCWWLLVRIRMVIWMSNVGYRIRNYYNHLLTSWALGIKGCHIVQFKWITWLKLTGRPMKVLKYSAAEMSYLSKVDWFLKGRPIKGLRSFNKILEKKSGP